MQQPPIYSPDRNWVWDGETWRPLFLPRRPGLFWFFEAADWALPVFLTTLIALIPVAGAMVAYGWVLEARDNLRRSLLVVPPASFKYIDRGALPVVAALVISAANLLVLILFAGFLVVAIVERSSTEVVAALVALLFVVGFGLLAVQGFLFAAILSVTDRFGLREGLRLGRLWRVSTANGATAWRVAGAYTLGALLALLIPFVGSFFLAAAYLMATPALAEFDEAR